jgi:hypothetical protein
LHSLLIGKIPHPVSALGPNLPAERFFWEVQFSSRGRQMTIPIIFAAKFFIFSYRASVTLHEALVPVRSRSIRKQRGGGRYAARIPREGIAILNFAFELRLLNLLSG